MTFQENLVRERKARGLSQEDLAARVGVSRQAVSKWETGDALPDLPRLLALADALDMSLDALCGREGPSGDPPAPTAVPPAAAPVRRRRQALRLVCGALALCLLAGGLRAWSRRNIVPSESAAADTPMPEALTVSGVSFSTGDGGMLDFRFVPGAVEADCTYQMVFTDSEGQAVAADAACAGGICTGSAYLPAVSAANPCTVAVTVTRGDNSRGVAVADGLWFEDHSVQWSPVGE